MTKSHLRACPACARHVRVSEEACPFCGGALATSFRSAPAPQAPGVRLSRAAMFAFGTGAISLAPGCTTTTQALYGAPPVEVLDGGDSGSPQALYGGPPLDSGVDTGQPAPAYGGPPTDAGQDAADAGGSDAAEDAPHLVDAAYGGPPFDSGND